MYVVVQAGGRGSRLRHHTWNKPKCLVSVRGRPILYHFFDRFPGASFVVIGDYGFDKLESYLAYNPPAVPVQLVKADGKGTCAGLADALALVPADAPVLVAWSDLLVRSAPPRPATAKPVIGVTDRFVCRWTISDEGRPHELSGTSRGIPGLFWLPRRDVLPPPPAEGEFVRWLAGTVEEFETEDWSDIEELGEFATIETINRQDGFTRFFNKVEMRDETVEKTVVDPAFAPLQRREIAWYRDAAALGFRRIPRILGETPFVMERLPGTAPHLVPGLTEREKRAILADSLDALAGLHATSTAPTEPAAVEAVYLAKSIERVESVRRLVPMIERPDFTVNGIKCRNPFAEKHDGLLAALCRDLVPPAFAPIHGDPTFSNTVTDENLRCRFIDPRGYFARDGILGDPNYDFAKVYYSAVGHYDAFNRRQFKLHIDSETVEVMLDRSPFADAAEAVFPAVLGPEAARVRVIHGLIWLSLSGYVKDDIDSVIGAFFLGLHWLEQATRA